MLFLGTLIFVPHAYTKYDGLENILVEQRSRALEVIPGSSTDTLLLVGHNQTKIQKNVWEIEELSNRKYREAKSRNGGKNIPTLGLSTDALLGYDHAKFQKKRMRNLGIFESPFLRKLSAPKKF